MSQINLGQAAIVSKGAYSSGTTYLPLNLVSYQGGTFLCIAQCTGVVPTNGTYWIPAAKGIQGCAVNTTGTSATITVTFSDGTTYSTTYATTAIGNEAVGTNQLAPQSVTGAKIADTTIDHGKLAANSVWANNIKDGNVTLGKIENLNTSGYLWQIHVQTSEPAANSPYGIYLVYQS